MTFEQIKKSVSDSDPKCKEGMDEFDAAVLLISALHVGNSLRALSKFTGIPKSKISPIKQRLAANKVWLANGKTYCEWFDKENGGTAFWMDVAVALGMMTRT